MRRPILKFVTTFALTALPVVGLVAGSDWPQFRGADGGVAADDPSLPDTWGPTENIVWRVDVPGRAWSSPIVSSEQPAGLCDPPRRDR